MLPKATVARIASLLRQNQSLDPVERLSNRAIAKDAKCSRRPVDEMARGLKRPRKRGLVDDDVAQLRKIFGRCPSCGRSIRRPRDGWPCLACRSDDERSSRAARKRARKKKRG
jgi:hypothetical protein